MSAVENTPNPSQEQLDQALQDAAAASALASEQSTEATPRRAPAPPTATQLTSFGPETDTTLPAGTQWWLVQMKRMDDPTRTTQFSVYVHDGICIDGGEPQQRWLFNRRTTWVEALRWMTKQGAHGILYKTL